MKYRSSTDTNKWYWVLFCLGN